MITLINKKNIVILITLIMLSLGFYYVASQSQNLLDNPQRNNCSMLEELSNSPSSNFRFAFIDIKLNQFYKDYGLNCLGRLESKFFLNEKEFYQVYYSRSLYIGLSQLIPLALLIFARKKFINKNFLAGILFILFLYLQIIFSYKYSFNLLNNVSFFSGLMIFIFLYRSNYENS